MSGVEFLTDLKGLEKFLAHPCDSLSIIKTAKEKEKYQQMGALDYLVKPSTFEEYVQVGAVTRSGASL